MEVEGSTEEEVGQRKAGNGVIVKPEHRMIKVEVTGNIVGICI